MVDVSDEIRHEIVREFLRDSLAGNPARWPKEEMAFLLTLLEGERQLVRETSAHVIRIHFSAFGHPNVDRKLIEHIARLVDGTASEDQYDHAPRRSGLI